jgi:hypothetical protein
LRSFSRFLVDAITTLVRLFIVLSTCGLIFALRCHSPVVPPFILGQLIHHRSLAAFFLTDYQSPRIPYLERYITESFIDPRLDFEYYFVNYTHENVPELHSLYPPDEYRRMMKRAKTWHHPSKDVAAKFFFAIAYFLENSMARWMFRGTDDTVINFDRLPSYLDKLEERFNPETDFVFRGNCVTYKVRYPQGGSGYLLSRQAARALRPHGWYFFRKMRIEEDMTFGRFLLYFGMEMYNVTDEAFSGHYFGNESIGIVDSRRYEELELCPDPEAFAKVGCRPYVAPVREIVFYHEWFGSGVQAFKHARSLFSSDPRVHWWIPPNTAWPRMCRVD